MTPEEKQRQSERYYITFMATARITLALLWIGLTLKCYDWKLALILGLLIVYYGVTRDTLKLGKDFKKKYGKGSYE